MSATDIQIGGKHYKDLPIQPVQFIQANNMGFCEGNVVKYITRWRMKNGMEDLRKAAHYLDLIIDDAPALAAIRKGSSVIKPKITAYQYITENGLQGFEAAVIRWVYFWSHNRQIENLEIARSQAAKLIAQVNGEA